MLDQGSRREEILAAIGPAIGACCFEVGEEVAAREAARLVGDGKLLAVAGGGDTVSALNHAGVAEGFSYVSTAGGAFLEWLEGKPLPGVDVLRA